MTEKNNWFEVDDITQLDTPALLVFPERVKKNIATAISMVGSADRLRPHIKTHKSAAVIQLLQDAGIRQFKCATISEAELLAMNHANDVLLAYQPLGPKLQRFVQLILQYPHTQFSCLVDHEAAVNAIADTARQHQLQIAVFIDLNVGMNRTGIAPADALPLAMHCIALDGVFLRGLHAYDGHLRETDLDKLTEQCNAAFEPVARLRQQLAENGYEIKEIIAGGSPSFPVHAKREGVQCSPGTFVYWDAGYKSAFPYQQFLTAAVVITRVISFPASGKICTDLGHKSIAAENTMDKRVSFLNAADLTPVSQSEEHLVADVPDGHEHYRGELLYALPFHICPTVALYERVITIEDGAVTGEWLNSARNRKINL